MTNWMDENTSNTTPPEYRVTAPGVTASQTPQDAPVPRPMPGPVYTVRPSWELLWSALTAVAVAIALAAVTLSDGDYKDLAAVGGIIGVAAVRGLAGWILQTMTKPKDEEQ